MVLKGQFLERSVVIDGLDGLYHRGTREPPCAIASPHPAMGGSMTSPVIAELAWALTRAGHATLRFDYRGVGASRGTRRAVEKSLTNVGEEVSDLYLVADQLLATTNAASVCAVGYSFGAKVALEAARDPRISQLVLIAPPTAMADFSEFPKEKRTLIVCAENDQWCDRSKLPPCEVIPHADHFFRRGLTELGHLVAEFLREGRPPLIAQPDEPQAREEHREIELDTTGEDLELDLK